MQVSRIKILNFLGIDELEFEAGKFTAFTGRNGTGKTSGLEALKAALGSGHDPTLIRNGAEEALIELGIDDGSMIRTRIRPQGTDREMRDAGGVKLSSPATKIRALVDALSVNPIEFLTAKPEKRVAVLLESMPLKADAKRIEKITGNKISTDAHALDVISAVRKQVYDERTSTNGAVKAKRATIIQLENAIPADFQECTLDEESLLNEIEKIDAGRDDLLARIEKKITEEREIHHEDVKAIDIKISELQDQIHNSKLHIQERNAKAATAAQNAKTDAETRKAKVNADLRTIRQNQENIVRAKQTRETIIKMAVEADEMENVSKQQTKTLEALDAYKVELLAELPVPGLEVRDGDIYFKGVAFDRVNTAQKVKIAVEIAKLRAGKLGLVSVDGIEALDSESYEAFKAETLKSGLQMFTSRVGDNDFAVETES